MKIKRKTRNNLAKSDKASSRRLSSFQAQIEIELGHDNVERVPC
jgi:hypothetical protein